LIVLDASLVIAWLVTEQLPAGDTDVYNDLPDNVLVVPSHWPLEISNALRSRIVGKRLSVVDFHDIMERFDLLNVEVQSPLELDEIGPLARFAVTHELTTYDAAYVQLALQRRVPLATLDHAMRTAATKLNIPLLPA
jgi:predicted nucleic acid-binding protein